MAPTWKKCGRLFRVVEDLSQDDLLRARSATGSPKLGPLRRRELHVFDQSNHMPRSRDRMEMQPCK